MTVVISKTALIRNLHNQLLSEVVENPENSDSIAFLNGLIYKKHEKNAQMIRREIILKNEGNPELKKVQAAYNNDIINGIENSEEILLKTVDDSKVRKRRRLSVDFHSIDGVEMEDGDTINDENDDNLSQLKSRLLNGHSNSKTKETHNASLDDQLRLEESQQEDILGDMFSLLTSLKEGAQAFNAKLEQDGSFINAAEAGLDVTKNKLQKSGEVLKKVTSGNIGVFDALKFGGSCILMFLLALIVIKLFPKW